MKFTREVHCSDEFAGGTPEVMVVEIDAALAKRIRELAAEVKRLDIYAVQLFDYRPTWYLPDWDRKEEDEHDVPAPGEEYTSLDLMILHVSEDDFWWTANLKNAGVLLSCEPIAIADLPECADSALTETDRAEVALEPLAPPDTPDTALVLRQVTEALRALLVSAVDQRNGYRDNDLAQPWSVTEANARAALCEVLGEGWDE